jgi:hypothetical protein
VPVSAGDIGWWLRDPWGSRAPNGLLSVSTLVADHPILYAL